MIVCSAGGPPRTVRGPVVHHGNAGGRIRHQGRIDQRQRPRLQSTDRDGVARPNREDDLAGQMWRQRHLGAVVQDEPVDIPRGVKGVLFDDPLGFRQFGARVPK